MKKQPKLYEIELEGGEYYNIFQMKLNQRDLKFLDKLQTVCNSGKDNQTDEYGSIRIYFNEVY